MAMLNLNGNISTIKSDYHRRYDDDIFILFTSPEYLEAFAIFLNGCHANMSIYNWKWNAKQNFLFLMYSLFVEIKDIPLFGSNEHTFSKGIQILRVLPSTYKFGIVDTFLYRSLRIFSGWTRLHNSYFFWKKIGKKWLPWKFYK